MAKVEMTDSNTDRSVKSPSHTARRLRTAATALVLWVSMLLLALWGRNLWRSDVVWAPLPYEGHFLIASHQGQMEVTVCVPSASKRIPPRSAAPRWGADSYSVAGNQVSEILLPTYRPFRCRRVNFNREFEVMAPYWFLIPVSWLLAIVPWVRWSTRFSLRALLIAMTIIAVAIRIYVTSSW